MARKPAPKTRAPKTAAKKAARKPAAPRVGVLEMVTLHVNDFPTAYDFYANACGLKATMRDDSVGWAMFTVGPKLSLGIHRHASEPDGRLPGGVTGLMFTVKDVGKATEALRAKGAKIAAEPTKYPWGEAAEVVDPDGNLFMIAKYA